MNKRETERKLRIEDVCTLLGDKKFTEKEVMVAVMSKYNVSQRIAREYLNVALFRKGENGPSGLDKKR